MHELSLAVEILHIVEAAINEHQLKVVNRLRLTVGELASVEVSALATALTTALAGTPAQQADVEYITEPGLGRCQACGKDVPVHQLHDSCPLCDGFPVRLTQGKTLRVSAIEGY